jgi:hypothetical protein
MAERILRSLSRRAARALRPLIQGGPQQELWVVGFDESCRPVGLQRLVPGPQGQPFAPLRHRPALTPCGCGGGGLRLRRRTRVRLRVVPTLRAARR